MPTSSDWLGALVADPAIADAGEAGPGWLALLGDGEGREGSRFREAALFGGAGTEAPDPPPPDPDFEAAAPDPHAEALARAHAEGVAAGRAAAEAEGEALARRQRALRLSFRTLDEAALGVLADDLAATVLHLCEGVLGEAARDPAALRERCIAAARRIGGAAEALALHLHPDDIALLGEEALAALRIVPDPALEPGSIVIEGPDGSVCDGPAEWRRAIAASLRG
ncbi:MAG: flagellar biosynthesis protein [Sphingomonadales bacterium]|nr:flagellar biosynthesis protein [Sphingomonadales bacterium]